MTMTDYCCTGMLKGRMSGIIAVHDGGAMLTVRLAADDRAPGLQPYLILHYCPSCGARLPEGDDESADRGFLPAPPGRVVSFPDLRALR